MWALAPLLPMITAPWPSAFCSVTLSQLAGSPDRCLDTWLEIFEDGQLDGLLLPPPIVTSRGDAATGRNLERLIAPPFLRERVTCVERGELTARISYSVINPSWLTCYPVHHHHGEVLFTAAADDSSSTDKLVTSKLRWTVAVAPLRFGEPLVRGLTCLIVPAFTRSLAGRLDPRAADPAAEIRCAWTASNESPSR